MSELESIKSLEKYDAWKKAKRKRKNGISLISGLIGTLVGFLLTWAILKISVGDLWSLGKGAFSSEDKIMEIVPKVEEVDNKLKRSIVASPMNWISKKYEEQVTQEVLKGNLGAIASGIRVYCFILIFVWKSQ